MFRLKRFYFLAISSITFFTLVIFLNIKTEAASCATNILFVPGNFLKASGINFSYMGQRVCLYGATIYTSGGSATIPSCGNPPGGSWSNSSFTNRIDWDLCMAQQAHLNFIRVTNYADSSSSNPEDAATWSNIDYLISQAQKKGMFILMDLSSYAKHLESKNINPYDIAEDSGWQQFISFVTNRVNSYTNVAYKNTPNIAYYSVRGEVNPVGSSFPSSTTQGYLDFYSRTTNGIFSNDQNHLIEAGGLTHLNQSNSGIPWQQIFGLPHVSIASIHVYSANRLDPINGSNDLNQTLPAVSAWARQDNKPFDIQEYGLVNQLGDSQRASAMQTIIARAVSFGVASLVYWNLGPETTSGMHYDVNSNFPLSWQAFIQGASTFFGSQSQDTQEVATATPTTAQAPIINSSLGVPIKLTGIGNGTIKEN
ncbi:MAG: cellulase family glycosylhydrolase, partial [Candidatus Levyibacteriota bacterium]